MPSQIHEFLLSLFRHRADITPALLERLLKQKVPAYEEIEICEADLSQLTPTEYRADMVFLLRREGENQACIVLEVQLRIDKHKRIYVWPLYAAAAHAKFGCPTYVLVLTPSRRVARWARRPVAIGPPEYLFAPLVLGPDELGQLTDPQILRSSPELGLLALQARGKEDPNAHELAQHIFEGLTFIDDEERRILYYDFVKAMLSKHACGDSLLKSAKNDRLMVASDRTAVAKSRSRRKFAQARSAEIKNAPAAWGEVCE